MSDSSVPSMTNWRSSVARLAPSAVRTANSRWRVSARASSRLARLAQAMSSTKPTAACSTQIAREALPTISACTGSICSGWFFGSKACILTPVRSPHCGSSACSSASAAAGVTPGFSRPIR